MSDLYVKDEVLTEEKGNRLREVTVFMGEAHLKREARCQAEAGLHRWLVETQAFQVDPDSVQASIRGKGEIQSVQYSKLTVAAALCEAGADVNARRKDGLTALDLALKQGKTDFADLLRKHGAKSATPGK